MGNANDHVAFLRNSGDFPRVSNCRDAGCVRDSRPRCVYDGYGSLSRAQLHNLRSRNRSSLSADLSITQGTRGSRVSTTTNAEDELAAKNVSSWHSSSGHFSAGVRNPERIVETRGTSPSPPSPP